MSQRRRSSLSLVFPTVIAYQLSQTYSLAAHRTSEVHAAASDVTSQIGIVTSTQLYDTVQTYACPNGQTYENLVDEAERATADGDFAVAKEMWHDILRQYPQCSNIHTCLATCLLGMGELEEAKLHLDLALKFDPSNAHAYNMYGKYYQLRGELQESREKYARAIELDNSISSYHIALAQINSDLENWNEVKCALNDMLSRIKKSEFNATAHEIETGWKLFGVACMKTKQYDLASKAYFFLTSQESGLNNYKYFNQLGYAEFYMGRIASSKLAFEKSIHLHSDSKNIANQARFAILQAEKMSPNIVIDQLDSRYCSNVTDTLTWNLQMITTIFPDYAPVHAYLGAVYLKLGALSLVKNEIDTTNQLLSNLTSKRVDALRRMNTNNLAKYYLLSNKKKEAHQVYEQTLEMDPANLVALYNLAVNVFNDTTDVFASKKYWIKFIEQYIFKLENEMLDIYNYAADEMIFIDGEKIDMYNAYEKLLDCCQASSDDDNAIEVLKEMINLKPKDAQLHFRLGMMQFANNMPRQAIEMFTECLKLKPDFEQAATWLVHVRDSIKDPSV